MAQTPESKVKAKVVKLIKAHGIYYFFPATYGFGRSGVPDVVCCAKGKFIAIECKAGNNKPTALQEKEMADIRKAGGHAYVVNEESLTLLGATLRSLLNEDDIDGRC
jgi:Holliday junction resolvase